MSPKKARKLAERLYGYASMLDDTCGRSTDDFGVCQSCNVANALEAEADKLLEKYDVRT